jgi:predicted enzyme related to lactoylglutathione lyase
MIHAQRVDFFGIPVRDLSASARFYSEVLGLERNPISSDEYPEFEVGGATLSLYAPEQMGQPFTASSAAVALRVPDVETARRTLEDAGIAFHGETMDTGVCHMAFFADPDGNALMLHHRYAPYADGRMP